MAGGTMKGWWVFTGCVLSIPILAVSLVFVVPSHAKTTQSVTTITYLSADGVTRIGMDVYAPAGTPVGAVVAVHGGGWHCCQNRTTMAPVCDSLAADGYICFAPDYRFAPYPAATDDLRRALQAIDLRYGYGPDQLIGFGASAGANLIAMLAVAGLVKAAAAWSPPSDLTTVIAQGCSATLASSVRDYAPGTRSDASPVFDVSATTGPLLVANSTNEMVPLAQAREMLDAFSAAGAPLRLDILPGTAHAMHYFDSEWPTTRAWLEAQ